MILCHLECIRKKEEGHKFLAVLARGGGGHSGAYRVQHGGLGGLKIGGKCVCNLWKTPMQNLYIPYPEVG